MSSVSLCCIQIVLSRTVSAGQRYVDSKVVNLFVKSQFTRNCKKRNLCQTKYKDYITNLTLTMFKFSSMDKTTSKWSLVLIKKT